MSDKGRTGLEADCPVWVSHTVWSNGAPFNKWTKPSSAMKKRKEKCQRREAVPVYVNTGNAECWYYCTCSLSSSYNTLPSMKSDLRVKYSETLSWLISVSTATTALVWATVLVWNNCKTPVTPEKSALKDTENSGVLKYSTIDFSSGRLILTSPTSFSQTIAETEHRHGRTGVGRYRFLSWLGKGWR